MGWRLISWVSGAGGQIGTSLCRQLDARGINIVGFGRNSAPDLFPGRWIQCNLGNESQPDLDLEPPDVLYHLSGQTSAYVARSDVESDVRANILGLVQFLDMAIKSGASPFVVMAGAATEVGLLEELVVNEQAGTNPETFYDLGKVVQSLYLKQFAREGWLSGCTIRLANVYGGGKSTHADRGFINKSVVTAFSGNPLTFFSDGEYIRDFLFVDDAASALIAAGSNQAYTNGKTFVVGTGKGTRIEDVLVLISKIVFRYTGLNVPVISTEPPRDLYPIEGRNVVIDASMFRNGTKWSPQTTLESGIESMVLGLVEGQS